MYLGLDFGTSGARACVINTAGAIIHQARLDWLEPAAQSPLDWRTGLHFLLRDISVDILQQLRGIAVDATSATVLLCDDELEPISPALMYADNRAAKEAQELTALAPHGNIACAATSGLAKFCWLTRNCATLDAAHFMHQADWITALLTGRGGITDYHNALKTGYDTERLRWPEWALALPHAHLLPQVLEPGAAIAPIAPAVAAHFGIAPDCMIHAGTTDSIAAFIATGANHPGDGVTSLGTTLVLKLLSERRVEDAASGVYSHRYGNLWLAGGASNAGGGVLRQHFSDTQLATLSNCIHPEIDSPLDYYPLTHIGERFPINDAQLAPRLTPRPADDAEFLHGLLQGLSRIEASGYAKLEQLGATPLRAVITCGGGAKNVVWSRIRERMLGVPVTAVVHAEAAYGAALLARRGLG
ncbi:MAG: FGGY-family carbohydrate kinase [Gallionellaceae bacterium]|jgi:sugar (pentulose or hexulose) kinase|nr:FGGY-family carbohydrate kinase [Gallionellaceae bacterium]